MSKKNYIYKYCIKVIVNSQKKNKKIFLYIKRALILFCRFKTKRLFPSICHISFRAFLVFVFKYINCISF